jgi:electron transfer flavoprotein alpha subunit
MAGKDDLRLLSSFVYSKLGTAKDEDDIEALGAITMNRATSLGSITEAVQTMSPSPDMIELMKGSVQGKKENEYKRVIQITSRMLRGSADPTGGAIDFMPKHSKNQKAFGLNKTYATKNYNFYSSPKQSSGGVQNMQTPIV